MNFLLWFWWGFVWVALQLGANKQKLLAGLRKGREELIAEGKHTEAETMRQIIEKVEWTR